VRCLALQDGELMPEGENLHLKFQTRANGISFRSRSATASARFGFLVGTGVLMTRRQRRYLHRWLRKLRVARTQRHLRYVFGIGDEE
jgi:hypothetical protein